MKKMLSLILALMLLALCPAMAETAEVIAQTQTILAPDGSYSVEVPASYIPANMETMMALFATEEMQQFLAQMMGLEDASQLAMYFEMLEASNMVVVYTETMAGNLNVQMQATSATMEQIVALKSLLDATNTEQFLALGVPEEDIHPMEIQEIGGRSWYGIQLEMMGMPMLSMLMIENGVQYTVTFTGMDAQEALSILESFTVMTAAE